MCYDLVQNFVLRYTVQHFCGIWSANRVQGDERVLPLIRNFHNFDDDVVVV